MGAIPEREIIHYNCSSIRGATYFVCAALGDEDAIT
jgi:hypothetical protein